MDDLCLVVDCTSPAPDAGAPEFLTRAKALATQAREYADQGHVDEAWHFIFRAREWLVGTWGVSRLTAEALALRAEVRTSEKFSKWRAEAIGRLVDAVLSELQPPPAPSAAAGSVESSGPGPSSGDTPGGNPATRTAAARPQESLAWEWMTMAMRLRNEQYENEYRRVAIVRRHQKWLLLVGFVPLGCLIGLLSAHAEQMRTGAETFAAWLLWASLCAGVTGAVVSAVQRSLSPSVERYPRQVSSLLASLSRVPLGAVAGLTAWLTAHVATEGATSAPVVLLAAFAAGFAERIVSAKAPAV